MAKKEPDPILTFTPAQAFQIRVTLAGIRVENGHAENCRHLTGRYGNVLPHHCDCGYKEASEFLCGIGEAMLRSVGIEPRESEAK